MELAKGACGARESIAILETGARQSPFLPMVVARALGVMDRLE